MDRLEEDQIPGNMGSMLRNLGFVRGQRGSVMSGRNLVPLAFSGAPSGAAWVGYPKARPQEGNRLGGCSKPPAESGSRDGEEGVLRETI